MLNCPQCGRENAATAKFCVHCGSAMAAAAPSAPPQQAPPAGQPGGFAQGGYQAPYRAPRQPFTGNIMDHWPFLLMLVFTFLASLALATGGKIGMGGTGHHVVWTNGVLLFIFNLLYFLVGLVGLAGAVGLSRFLDWSRWFVVLALATFAFDGLLLVIGGSMSKAEGSHIAQAILTGLVQAGIAGFGIYYVGFSHEVGSRLRRAG